MSKKQAAIIICSRTDSERLPNKPFRKINGVPLIQHLINRVSKTNLEIILAVPCNQINDYRHLEGVRFYDGYASDPLARMAHAASHFGIDTAVRITHDKFMLNPKDITDAIECFNASDADYMFGSRFIPGTGFEVIDTKLLLSAAERYRDVEFIGYAARSLAKNIIEFKPLHPVGRYRLLVDYPSDVQFFEVILSQLGSDCTLEQAILYLNEHPEIKQINRLPRLTLYTCAFNAEKWIERCMMSVAMQRIFHDIEYIIVDDFSSDKTTEIVAKFACKFPNVSWIRNSENMGLASSSNVALKASRGDYIMRLDADDYFVSLLAAEEMLAAIYMSGREAIYPDNYFGGLNYIQDGVGHHHAGGAIFDKRAINHIKFTDGLRNYEGLDLWARAQQQLKIGYLKKPMFFYTQHEGSMSKTNINDRAKIKKRILDKYFSDLSSEITIDRTVFSV